jgi:hypothetical protein
MNRGGGRSLVDEGPRSEDLVVLERVRVGAIYYPEGPHSPLPYFEVEHEGETLRVRMGHDNVELKEWLEGHREIDINLTIFPYAWKINGDDPERRRSGVVNYFNYVEVAK